MGSFNSGSFVGFFGVFLFLVYLFICLFFRERVGERSKEGERESQAGSMLSAESDSGLDLTTLGP